MAESCHKPKVKFLECVLTSKCYKKEKSFEKCIKHWKKIFDEGDPDPPCYHERRILWLCHHGEWDTRNRFRGNRYNDPADTE